MTLYMTLLYLFQVLPLLHWIFEFSKDNDYNVFWPSLPFDLTHYGASVINPNGTSPSECQHFICWYTKGHLWIEGLLNTIDGHDMRCIHYPTSLPFYLSICWLSYVTISTATRVHTRLSSLTTCVVYMTILIATHVQICTRVSLIETRVSYAGCQYQ